MGTASTALYADDVACDVRDQFIELLARTRNAPEAKSELLKSWQASLADDDERGVVWMALADTQWKYGCLDEQAKLAAIEVIDSGAELLRWDGRSAVRRKAMQAALKEKLLAPQPKARIPRIRKSLVLPSTKCLSSDEQALATAFALGESADPGAPRMQVIIEMISAGNVGGGGVFTAGCEYFEAQLEWLDPSTLKITYPAACAVGQRCESLYYFGRTIKVVYEERS